MKVEDFNYTLPEELIAQHPSDKRDHARMMVLNKSAQSIQHKNFYNIPEFIGPDDLLVVNNTKVIPARIYGKKETGANIEIFLLGSIDSTHWETLVRPAKRVKKGTRIILKNQQSITITEKLETGNWVIETSEDFEQYIHQVGNMPLPPYIKREAENEFEPEDKDRYQTVYAKQAGAVAAPTAGLHFTNKIMKKLKTQGTKVVEITLHVGLGTFRPIKCDKIEDHVMHKEFYSLTEEVAESINKHKQEGKRVIPVGTTSIRTLETIASNNNGQLKACSGWSDIFIYPGYQFKITDGCITNFHLPKSTLIMLISALAGKEFIFNAYNEAIKESYRFYSYGDCMLIL